MKLIKNETGEPHHSGYAIFDSDERQRLQKLLPKNIASDKNWMFINQCQFLCNRILRHREQINQLEYKPQKKQDIDEPRKDALVKLEIAEQILNDIATGKVRPYYPQNLSDISDQDFDQSNFSARDHAVTALSEVRSLIIIFQGGLEVIKDKRTHNTEFASDIYDAYVQYIGEPTTSENDSFVPILQILFKAVGIDLQSPRQLADKIIKIKSNS